MQDQLLTLRLGPTSPLRATNGCLHVAAPLTLNLCLGLSSERKMSQAMRVSLLLEWLWVWCHFLRISSSLPLESVASCDFPLTNALRSWKTACTAESPRPPLLLWTPVVAISSLFFPEERFVVALFDYAAVNDRDLQVLKGEKLQVLKR